MDERFVQVGILPAPEQQRTIRRAKEKKPVCSAAVLGLILAGCFLGGWFWEGPPYMDLYRANLPPGRDAWFGTDAMGRDLFSMIWPGGRVSLSIGLLATALSTAAAVLLGTLSGLGPKWLDRLLMRFTELFLSVPGLLLAVFFQAILGKANAATLSLAIGATGWTGMAKVIRTEVRQMRQNGAVLAARCMGAGFFWILRKHLTPNFMPAILFMVVMNIRNAMAMESTLSFMGIGLPLETISWGSMLSLAEKGLLSGAWWTVLVPGAFLAVTILCITDIGNYLRRKNNPRSSGLPG